MKRSIFSILIIIAVIAAAVLVGAFYIYRGWSLSGIDLSLTSSSTAAQLGTPFMVHVSVTNHSNGALSNVRVAIDLPDGLVVASNHSERVIEDNIKQLASGGSFSSDYTLVAIPSSNNGDVLKADVYYSPPSVVAIFDKSANLPLVVANPNITLTLTTATSTVFSGQEFSVTANYANNGSSTLSALKLKFDYPSGFTLTSASPAATSAGSAWDLGSAANGGSGQVSITGQVNLPDNASFPVAASLIGNIDGQDYVLLSDSINMNVAKSPLSLSISLNGGDPNQVVYPGETLNYVLTYTNNTPSAFNDITINTQISGGMINWGTVQTNGISSNYGKAIVWSPSSLNQLTSLASNSLGTVSFSLQLDNPYPIQYVNSKNFSVKIKAQASSPTVPYLINAGNTQTVAVSEAKVAGEIAVQSAAYFRDAASGAMNSGPWPPKAGQATEYTIHWNVSNYVTDVSNLVVQSVLPPGVSFVGVVQNYASSTVSYNQPTNSVIWNIGDLPATTGIITPSPQIVFQISAAPQSSDIGNYMTILNETDASATDTFSGITLTASSSPITSLLPSDPSVSVGQGIVGQ